MSLTGGPVTRGLVNTGPSSQQHTRVYPGKWYLCSLATAIDRCFQLRWQWGESSPVRHSPGLSECRANGSCLYWGSCDDCSQTHRQTTGALPGDLAMCQGPRHPWPVMEECFLGSSALFVYPEDWGRGNTSKGLLK